MTWYSIINTPGPSAEEPLFAVKAVEDVMPTRGRGPDCRRHGRNSGQKALFSVMLPKHGLASTATTNKRRHHGLSSNKEGSAPCSVPGEKASTWARLCSVVPSSSAFRRPALGQSSRPVRVCRAVVQVLGRVATGRDCFGQYQKQAEFRA